MNIECCPFCKAKCEAITTPSSMDGIGIAYIKCTVCTYVSTFVPVTFKNAKDVIVNIHNKVSSIANDLKFPELQQFDMMFS